MNKPNAVAPINGQPDPEPAQPDTPGSPFFARWNALIRELNVDPSIKLVARTMADHADESGKGCDAGSETLALETSYSKRTIYNALTALKDLGIVVRTRRGVPYRGMRDEYQLIIPSNWEDVVRAGDKPVFGEAPAPREPMPVLAFEDEPKPSNYQRTESKPERRRKKRPAPEKSDGQTVLYHYYDEDDGLLYIGITSDMRHRLSGHEKASTWMDFAVRSTIDRFPTREAAEDAERRLVMEKRPLFNVQFNDFPDRQKRLVEYLIGRGRYDLLVPEVDRG